ncbi:MAG: response regulator [Patescibacteria group bacterium]
MLDSKIILIVEDDRFLSSLIKARLAKEGYEAAQAFDGEEGRQYLKTKKPDLILLDLIMPKVPGFELLEQISLDPNLNKIPVVVLTNLAQESDVKKARQLGATEYFVKARVSIDDLVKRVYNLLNKQ